MSTEITPHRLTFACDDVKYVRKDRPEVWITPDKINGKMFVGYPMVSFIPGSQGMEEPIQYGRFVIDIDTQEIACQDAIKIVDWFSSVYGVDPEQWQVFLSGKKGVHLELSDKILGVEYGHKFLTLGFKRLAKDIEGELNVKLDTSMYNMGTPKPYRQPNVIRDTGTCKRQIEFNDLYEITGDDEYRIACNEPGSVWDPSDTGRNDMLAAKIQVYLQESEAQREIIRNAPVLSPDDIDRLANDIPPCIKVLANLTQWAKGNTFNDIALQLTAYAITSGRTEAEFLSGCSPFIENYPSSSLNTPAKRYENCRARFRTMSVNGNQHSCGGILSLKIPGFDCDTCPSRPATPAPTIEVMTADDLQESHLSLNIPEDVVNPGGLISLGMAALRSPGMTDIPQYNLAVVLTTLANSIAGKITAMDVWPNLYNIKCGPTSTGKTSSDKTMTRAITEACIPGFYGVTDFASGPALMRSLSESPVNMMVVDECTSMFKRYDHSDANSDGKRDALMEIYSASGGILKKVYSDARNTIIIEGPCLSLTGNATTTIFEAIKQEDFDTGTMQRFDFWCYDGPTPKRGISTEKSNDDLSKFATAIFKIRDSRPPDGNLCGMGGKFRPYAIDVTKTGRDALISWSNDVVDRCNAATSDGDKGIISRQFDLCIKYAMVHLAATRPVEALYLPLDESNIEYGKKVALMLGDWKINVLRSKVTTGDFHRRCEIFKEAIRAVVRMGKKPTLKTMRNRRPQIKNWTKRETDDVIFMVTKSGDVVVDNSQKNTIYELPKE
jgi:hypothetical protein